MLGLQMCTVDFHLITYQLWLKPAGMPDTFMFEPSSYSIALCQGQVGVTVTDGCNKLHVVNKRTSPSLFISLRPSSRSSRRNTLICTVSRSWFACSRTPQSSATPWPRLNTTIYSPTSPTSARRAKSECVVKCSCCVSVCVYRTFLGIKCFFLHALCQCLRFLVLANELNHFLI